MHCKPEERSSAVKYSTHWDPVWVTAGAHVWRTPEAAQVGKTGSASPSGDQDWRSPLLYTGTLA